MLHECLLNRLEVSILPIDIGRNKASDRGGNALLYFFLQTIRFFSLALLFLEPYYLS